MRKIIKPFEKVLNNTIEFTKDMYFNPVIHGDGNTVISEEEYAQIDASVIAKYGFLKNMSYIEWVPLVRVIQEGEV